MVDAERKHLEKQIAKLHRGMDRVVASNERLSSMITALHADLAASRAENAKLKAELAAARGMSSTAPTVPSGQQPVYTKPRAKKSGKRGREGGHVGVNRKVPEKIDAVEEHLLRTCPTCNERVTPMKSKDGGLAWRVRYVEDVEFNEPKATEHRMQRCWCKKCGRTVEPAVTAALPGDRIGLKVLIWTAVQHYHFGVSIRKIIEMLRQQHKFEISSGALSRAWRRLSMHLVPRYVEIWEKIKIAGALHADETGWRVNGSTHWLWCFCTKKEVYYAIEPSRSSKIAVAIIGDAQGTLIRDFYAAYNACEAESTQVCTSHLFREFQTVRAKHPEGVNQDFEYFEKKVKEIIREAIEYAAKTDHGPPERKKAMLEFQRRMHIITDMKWNHPDAERLARRISDHMSMMFTFVAKKDVDPKNNHAERMIRPAVIMRKSSYGNQSDKGAYTQAVLMSVFRSMHL